MEPVLEKKIVCSQRMWRKQEELVSAWTIHLVVVVREVFGNLWKTDFQNLLCISLGSLFTEEIRTKSFFFFSSFFFHSCIQKKKKERNTVLFFLTIFYQLAFRFAIHSIIIDKFRFQLIYSQSIKVCSIKGGFGCHRSVEYMFVFSCIHTIFSFIIASLPALYVRMLHSLTLDRLRVWWSALDFIFRAIDMFVKFLADQRFMLSFLMNTLIDCCKLISFICIVCCFIIVLHIYIYIYGITELRIDFDVDIVSVSN